MMRCCSAASVVEFILANVIIEFYDVVHVNESNHCLHICPSSEVIHDQIIPPPTTKKTCPQTTGASASEVQEGVLRS
jgi:hypothetical protein